MKTLDLLTMYTDQRKNTLDLSTDNLHQRSRTLDLLTALTVLKKQDPIPVTDSLY